MQPGLAEVEDGGNALPESQTRPVAARPAFRDVYRTHFQFVWRSLRRLGVQEDECADAAQQVFIIVHRRLAEFRHEAKLTTWLFAICANVAANTNRSRVRRRSAGSDELDEMHATPSHLRIEARLTIERLLEGMPLDQRTTFLLFEVEQLTCAEIATVMESSVGTVKSRLRLARERVARRLGLEPPARDEATDE